jgi:transcriptional regulator with XRE-family HTH domain
MNDKNTYYEQIGSRIQAARKKEGLSQTQLATMLGKSLRTVQKYESGEIELSIATVREIANILSCRLSYLIGCEPEPLTLSTVADVMDFFFRLDMVNEIGFDIEVKQPPYHDGWECAVSFNGKDSSVKHNQDLCLFLEKFKDLRKDMQDNQADDYHYPDWQHKMLAYYNGAKLTPKDDAKHSHYERLLQYHALLSEQREQNES